MQSHILPFESELQNESPTPPVLSQRLTRYGADALTVEEHLALLVGGEILAAHMLKYFGSILALSRASLCELRKFLPKRKAESLIAALRVSAYGEAKHALSEPLNRPEMVYSACLDMHMFNQEVLRVLLLNARFRLITSADVCKGTLNESVAHSREIFRPAIVHSAYALVLVHNHPSGAPSPSEADLRLARRILEAGRILQLQLIDHVNP